MTAAFHLALRLIKNPPLHATPGFICAAMVIPMLTVDEVLAPDRALLRSLWKPHDMKQLWGIWP
jgi:hypothetical protein